MKIVVSILVIILTSGFVFYLTSCKNKSKVDDKNKIVDQDTIENKAKENGFERLRNMAFIVTPE